MEPLRVREGRLLSSGDTKQRIETNLKRLADEAVSGRQVASRKGKPRLWHPHSIPAYALRYVPGSTEKAKCLALSIFKNNKPVAVRPAAHARNYIRPDGKTSLVRGPCGDLFTVATSKQKNKRLFGHDKDGNFVLEHAHPFRRVNYYFKRVAVPRHYIHAVSGTNEWATRNQSDKTHPSRFREHVTKYRKANNKWKDLNQAVRGLKGRKADIALSKERTQAERIARNALPVLAGLPYYKDPKYQDGVTKLLKRVSRNLTRRTRKDVASTVLWEGPPRPPVWARPISRGVPIVQAEPIKTRLTYAWSIDVPKSRLYQHRNKDWQFIRRRYLEDAVAKNPTGPEAAMQQRIAAKAAAMKLRITQERDRLLMPPPKSRTSLVEPLPPKIVPLLGLSGTRLERKKEKYKAVFKKYKKRFRAWDKEMRRRRPDLPRPKVVKARRV